MKRQLTEWENTLANISDTGLIPKIYKELTKLNTTQKNKIKKFAKDLNRHFSKQDILMTSRHMKRCSMSLIIREMQIKATMRYHLTCVRMAIINKSTNNRCWQECGERGTSGTTIGRNADWCSHCGKQHGDT